MRLKVFILLSFSLFSLGHCIPDGADPGPDEIRDQMKKNHVQVQDRILHFNGYSMHYVHTGLDKGPLVLWIHGSPGSWNAYLKFLVDPDLRENFSLLAIDRPGFGESDPGKPIISLQEQARRIHEVLLHFPKSDKTIVVGHSYGGPVAVRLAMDYPEDFQGMILVAASVDPKLEERHWYNEVASWSAVQWILPQALIVSNAEIWPLKKELERMLKKWQNLKLDTVVIQGGDDTLVPPANADFILRHLQGAKTRLIKIADMNHFVPWTHPELIKASLLSFLRKVPK